MRQRYARPYPNLENTPADAFSRRDGGFAATLENRSEHQVVNRRPAVVRLGYCMFVQIGVA